MVERLRADGGMETVGAGQVVTIEAGDTIVENPEISHFGANEGDVTVEIHNASRFTEGSPPAIPLPCTAP